MNVIVFKVHKRNNCMRVGVV